MPRKGRSNEEIIHALHQVEGGEKVTEVCRRLGVSEQTFYRWKKQFAGLGLSERCASSGPCATKTAS
jgi:putative transposase